MKKSFKDCGDDRNQVAQVDLDFNFVQQKLIKYSLRSFVRVFVHFGWQLMMTNVMSKKMMMIINMTKIMMIVMLLLMAMTALKILKRDQENIEDIEMRSRSGETPMLSRGE